MDTTIALEYGDIIFRTANGTNEIYDGTFFGEPCYIIKHVPRDFAVVTDHNAKIINSVIKKIRRTKHALVFDVKKTGKHMLKFAKSGREKPIALRYFLYAKYEGLKLDAVRGKKICLVDDRFAVDGVLDFRRCNLYDAGAVRPHTASRDIEVVQRPGSEEKYIVITVRGKQKEVKEYTEYEPELFELLASPTYCRISLNEQKERTLTVVHYANNKAGESFDNLAKLILIYRLCFKSYRGRNGAVKRFVHDYNMISQQYKGMEASHINGDKQNNCFDNLMFMREANHDMADYVRWFLPPYSVYTTKNARDEVLIEFAGDQYYRCPTPEDYADWQKVFLGKVLTQKLQAVTYATPDGLAQELTPHGMVVTGKVTKETAKTNKPDIWEWMERRDMLLALDAWADKFTTWKAGAWRTISGAKLPDVLALGASVVIPWETGVALITRIK